jgi:hypothetical protein
VIRVDKLVVHPPAKEAQARRVGARNGNQWCHLFCDTPAELDRLHDVAAMAGLRRSWFQASPPASMPHYDLTPSRRAEALRFGAVEGDRYQLVAAMKLWRAHLKGVAP